MCVFNLRITLTISEQRCCSSRSSRSTFSGHLDTQRRNSGRLVSNFSSSSCSYSSPSSLTVVAVPRAERIASTSAESIGTTLARLQTDSRASAPSSLPPLSHLPAPSSSVLPPRRLPTRARRCPAQSRTPSGVLPSSISSACCSSASTCLTMTNSCSSPLQGLPLPRHSSVFSTWQIFLVSTTSSM